MAELLFICAAFGDSPLIRQANDNCKDLASGKNNYKGSDIRQGVNLTVLGLSEGRSEARGTLLGEAPMRM